MLVNDYHERDSFRAWTPAQVSTRPCPAASDRGGPWVPRGTGPVKKEKKREIVLGSLGFVFVVSFDYVCVSSTALGCLGTHICTAFYVLLFR